MSSRKERKAKAYKKKLKYMQEMLESMKDGKSPNEYKSKLNSKCLELIRNRPQESSLIESALIMLLGKLNSFVKEG